MERNIINRIKFMFMRCRTSIETLKQKADREGSVDGLPPKTFQEILKKIEEMENLLNG